MSPARDRFVAASAEFSDRPVDPDPLEHALRSLAETAVLLGVAAATDPDDGRVDAAREALAGARATTEAVKFAIAALGEPVRRPAGGVLDRPVADAS